jgi:GTP-binding protein LepA
VIVLFRVIDGTIRPGMKIRFFNVGRDYQVETLGVNRPVPTPINELSVGEVGFLTASIKAVADVQIGDTVTEAARPTKEPFPGYQEIKPMVFAGLYPGGYRAVRRVARCARQAATE